MFPVDLYVKVHRTVLVENNWIDIYLIGKPERIASHRRSYVKTDFWVDPLHHLALLEKEPRSLDQPAPLERLGITGNIRSAMTIIGARMDKRSRRIYPSLTIAGNFQYSSGQARHWPGTGWA